MSFIFIIGHAKSKLQQCELVFEAQPGFSLLTRSIDKKTIRASIKNTQYLSQGEKETLQRALDTGRHLWFKRSAIKQYCQVYLPKMIKCPAVCNRFVTKVPDHALYFDESFHIHDELEDNILVHLLKISGINYAFIDALIVDKKMLRYQIKNYQTGQILPKNAILLMDYPLEEKQRILKEYQQYKHWELIKQIPEASVKLPLAILAAMARNPAISVLFILFCLLGLAQAFQAKPPHAQPDTNSEDPATAVDPANFKAHNVQQQSSVNIHLEERGLNPLFIAASKGDLEQVTFLLRQGSNTIIQNGNLLSEVILAGRVNVYTFLLENQLVDVNQKIIFKNPLSLHEKARQVPVLAAILKNRFEIIEQLINKQKLTMKTMEFYFDDIFLAVFSASDWTMAGQLANLLHNGSEVLFHKWDTLLKKYGHHFPLNGVQRFIKIFRAEDTRRKQYFLEKDVDNIVTILMELLKTKRSPYAKNLMKIAKIDINDRIGRQALLTHVVDDLGIESREKIRICTKLISWGADINQNDVSNPLMHAVQQDDLSLVLFLHKQGGKFVLSRQHALYHAILHNALKVMDYLLENVFDINQRRKKGSVTPILAIPKSKNRHMLRLLTEKYGLQTDVLLNHLDDIIESILAFDDLESWLSDFSKVLEHLPEPWPNRISLEAIIRITDPKIIDPAKILRFENFIKYFNYQLKVHFIYVPLQFQVKLHVIETYLPQAWMNLWNHIPDIAIKSVIVGVLIGVLESIRRTINRLKEAVQNAAKMILEKSEEQEKSLSDQYVEDLAKRANTILKLNQRMELIYKHIVEMGETPFPLKKSELKETLSIKVPLTDEEKKQYKHITVSDETRTMIVEKLCEFLEEAPKNPEEQGRLLRKEIIMRSPEYKLASANDHLINEMIPYLRLVESHQNQQAGFDSAFSEIRIKNSMPPILSKQQNILDKLKQHEQRCEVHAVFLKLFRCDLEALIDTIQKNKQEHYACTGTVVIYEGLNTIAKEREAIKQWCNTQGVTIQKPKIKNSAPEPVKKPVIKKSRNEVPQIPKESSVDNPVPAKPPVPYSPNALFLPREIHYWKKEETVISSEPKKYPVIKDARVLYIAHLMHLMRDNLKETDLVLQKNAARLLLSKCFGTIFTFCHLHAEAIQDLFPWWKHTWLLRNQILHNTVLWEQQIPTVLLKEFLDTFEKPFNTFIHQGFFKKTLKIDKLINLSSFMSALQSGDSLPYLGKVIPRMESLCLTMNSYYVMASDALDKHKFECDGLLHAAMGDCVLEMRDIQRDLSVIKTHPHYSGPQFTGQRKQCDKLLKIIHSSKMIEMANCIAHETTDFKDNEVSQEFYNGYQFRYEDQIYYVQEPVPYLALSDLFVDMHKHNHLVEMLNLVGKKSVEMVRPAVPVEMTSVTFAPD